MRKFELLIVIATLAYLLWQLFGTGLPSSIFRWLPFLAAALLVIHLVVEKPRWQMAPAYLLVALVLLLYPYTRSKAFRIALKFETLEWCGAIVLLTATGLSAGVLWPVFEFAPLTGSYPVGCVSAHLIDKTRRDPYSPSASAERELMVEVWYPAETTKGFRRAEYRDGRQSGYGDSALALVETRSFADAPIAKQQREYPVLLFTGPNNRFQNTFETEDLASHGFVVIGIDHPYDSDLVVFPDGRRVVASKEAGLLDFSSEEALKQSTERVERRLAVRVADTEFVLDQLERWQKLDSSNRFYGRLNLGRIGMFGHSFGGAVAAEICHVDPRVRAGVNMDGSMFGRAKLEGVSKPFLFMFDATQRPGKADLESTDDTVRREALGLLGDFSDIDRNLSRYGGYFFQVPGLEHMNYTDSPLYSQWKPWSGAGAIGIRRAHDMVIAVTVAFFRRELLDDRSASVKAAVRRYPEAALREQSRPLQRL